MTSFSSEKEAGVKLKMFGADKYKDQTEVKEKI